MPQPSRSRTLWAPPPSVDVALPPLLPAGPFSLDVASLCSGVIYSVKHPDIKFVLPGGPGASPEALRDLAAAAQSLAGQEGLLELAWELAADSGAWRGWGGANTEA